MQYILWPLRLLGRFLSWVDRVLSEAPSPAGTPTDIWMDYLLWKVKQERKNV